AATRLQRRGKLRRVQRRLRKVHRGASRVGPEGAAARRTPRRASGATFVAHGRREGRGRPTLTAAEQPRTRGGLSAAALDTAPPLDNRSQGSAGSVCCAVH